MQKIRIGVIGTGQMGRSHIQTSQLFPDVEVVALADPNPESLEAAKKLAPQATASPDYATLVALTELDLIIIATPSDTHARIAEAALLAGKHILLEKPMATSMEGIHRIERARSLSGKEFSLDLELRHLPIFRKFKDLVASGEIGKPRMMWCKEFRGPFLQKVGNWIIKQEHSGGALLEKNVHHFDLFNWVIGSKPLSVIAMGARDVNFQLYGTEATVLDNAWVVVEYEGSARACLGLCLFAGYRPEDEWLELGCIGERGKLELHWKSWTIEAHYADRNEVVRYFVPVPPEIEEVSHLGALYYKHRDLYNALRQGAALEASIEDAKWATAVGIAAEISVQEKRIVTLKELMKGEKQ